MTEVRVGVDMSLSSPGVALQRLDCDTIHLLGFQQRLTDVEVGHRKLSSNLSVSRLSYPVKEKDRWIRSKYVVTTIIDWIRSFLNDGDTVHVYIENYALGMAGSSSVSKLCELGGMFRYFLLENGWTFSELSPGTVKKFFTGNGRASKAEMVQAYHEKHKYPLMNEVFKITDLQHPQEDMVDALAILLTGVAGVVPKKRKVRKRKRSPSKK